MSWTHLHLTKREIVKRTPKPNEIWYVKVRVTIGPVPLDAKPTKIAFGPMPWSTARAIAESWGHSFGGSAMIVDERPDSHLVLAWREYEVTTPKKEES